MKKLISLLVCLLIFALLCGCALPSAPEPSSADDAPKSGVEPSPAPEPAPEPEPEPEPEPAGEYAVTDVAFTGDGAAQGNDRVFYEIFVGSFSDSDGDGTGDLRGIINRMDYLNDGDPESGLSLGIEGIWLTPIYKSPSYHKYDVSDYYEIDPAFGTEADLIELVDLCHERDVKLILDLPINHTGSANAWFTYFKAAQKSGETDGEYYDFYSYYRKGEKAPAGRTFSAVAGTDVFVESNFSGSMPELNFDNERVREAVFDVAKHYLDLGVDGFRFDAAKYVYFGDNAASAAFWDGYIARLREIKPDGYFIAEVWDTDGITDYYYPSMNCFNFTISQSSGLIAETAKKGNVNTFTHYIDGYLDNIRAMREGSQAALFITNHDMDRAAGFLTASANQIQMAANLYILSPGSPFIYYGEELDMRGSRGGASTDANRRLAVVWGDGDTVKDPIGTTYDSAKKQDKTVAEQLVSETSLYNYYKRLIMLRKANPEIASGEYTALDFVGTKLGGFIAEKDGGAVCVLHNTTGSDITVDLSGVTEIQFTSVAGVIGLGGAELNGTELTLSSQTSVILR